MRDFLISPSAASCNGNVADGQLKWRCPFGKLRNSRNLREIGPRLFRFVLSVAEIGRINCGKASLLQAISEH